MPYTQQTWNNGAAGGTPISAARLTVMEDGIHAASPGGLQTLTDAATVVYATGGVLTTLAKVTLGGNRTLSITGAVAGSAGTLIVIQDGTGSRTLTLPGGSKAAGGAFTLSTAAGAVDVLAWVYDGTSYYWTIGKAFA